MKYLRITLISFIMTTALILSASSASAACGDPLTRNKCGERVGCNAGELCIYDDDAYNSSNLWKCVENEEKCGVERVDNSEGVHCGVTVRSKTWCGVSGGCAAGYLCTNEGLCKEDAGCANSSNIYNTMCGAYGSRNACGAGGGCAEGYRCLKVASGETGTGFACLDAPDDDNNYCPGSKQASQPGETMKCDETTTNPNATCNCTATGNKMTTMDTPGNYCCGLTANNECYPSQAEYDAAVGGGGAGDTPPADDDTGSGGGTTTPGEDDEDPDSGGGIGEEEATNTLNIFEGPNSQDFSDLNPLVDSAYVGDLSSPGGIISRVLLFAFPIAGLILFVMLVWAGFEILANAPSGKSIDAGKQRATAAIAGFILLFCTYWLMQVVEYVFGIVVL